MVEVSSRSLSHDVYDLNDSIGYSPADETNENLLKKTIQHLQSGPFKLHDNYHAVIFSCVDKFTVIRQAIHPDWQIRNVNWEQEITVHTTGTSDRPTHRSVDQYMECSKHE